MSKTRQIIDRLIEARKAAGLSQGQAAKLLGYSAASSLSQLETQARDSEPNLSMFLKMCEVYDISPVWALTGTNPDFDENAFDQLTQGVNASLEDICNLKETLKRLSYGNEAS
jgi:transcriptional regulator with XRE-family HTH domain